MRALGSRLADSAGTPSTENIEFAKCSTEEHHETFDRLAGTAPQMPPRWQPSLADYIDIAAYLLGADREAFTALPRLPLAALDRCHDRIPSQGDRTAGKPTRARFGRASSESAGLGTAALLTPENPGADRRPAAHNRATENVRSDSR